MIPVEVFHPAYSGTGLLEVGSLVPTDKTAMHMALYNPKIL